MVCGRNEALQGRTNRDVKKLTRRSAVSFTLLGFTTEMDELMAAADLYVGKPGGLTTSEALSKGLPMVVINPIPGQEERNSDHLLEQGAAIRCNNLPALAYKIDTLIDTPGKLARMGENAGDGKTGSGVRSGRPARRDLPIAHGLAHESTPRPKRHGLFQPGRDAMVKRSK